MWFSAGVSKSTEPAEEGSPEGGADSGQSPKSRRKRRRTALDLVPDEERPVDENGEPMMMNTDVVTMAELCVDMGVGRSSSRTEMSVTKAVEWKDGDCEV